MALPMKRAILAGTLGAIVCLASAPLRAEYVVFRSDAPFVGATTSHSLTTTDGHLTVAGWADSAATVSANLNQWWWVLGVNSGVGNGALIDGAESMTLQFASGWGASQIRFIYTGSGNIPAPITISGFLSDPGASAQTYASPRISNLSYGAGVLSFDYAPADGGGDFGILNFAHAESSLASTLKISYDLGSGGAALAQVDYTLVPEPASLGLLGFGALLLLGTKRQRR